MDVSFGEARIIILLNEAEEIEAVQSAYSEEAIRQLRRGDCYLEWPMVEVLAATLARGETNQTLTTKDISSVEGLQRTLATFEQNTLRTMQEMAERSSGSSEMHSIIKRKLLGGLAGKMATQLESETTFGNIVDKFSITTDVVVPLEPQQMTPPPIT